MTTSFEARFVAAVASNPVDVIKTRVMKVEPGAEPPYSGALDYAFFFFFFFFERIKTVLCTLFIYLFIYASPKKKKSITYSKIWTNNNQV